jgi:hypothetical protein
LRIDSISLGSGKTTTLEHLDRLCRGSQLIASLPSVALIPRLVDVRPTTLLLDEIDKTLNLKNPGVPEVLAIINSGYRFGAKRPVLTKNSEGNWIPEDLSTFCAVAMAGVSANLPADTRSREIRVVLMPDLNDVIEDTQWQILGDDVAKLAERIALWADSVREHVSVIPVEKPSGCRGRAWERWRPLLLVAISAGGRWPDIAARLVEQNVTEEAEMKDALAGAKPRVVVLLEDLHALWPETESFLSTEEILRRLTSLNAAFWGKDGDENPYGKELTAKGLKNMLFNAVKLTPRPELYDIAPIQPSRGANRGYFRNSFVPLWRRLQVGECETTPSPPNSPDERDATDASDADEAQSWDVASDASDASGIYEEEEVSHSQIEWCLDCGTELSNEQAALSSYCQECLDERATEEPPDE